MPLNIPSQTHVTTTISVSNLHCSSCVTTINEVLFSLSPPPTSVDASIVHQTVTVGHAFPIQRHTIQSMLEDAGFDVSDPDSTSSDHRLSQATCGMSTMLSGKRRKHIQHCSLCQEAAATSLDDTVLPHLPKAGSLSYDSPTDCSTLDGSGKDPESSLSPSHKVQVGADRDVPHLVTLSVGGMTCSSCSGTITEMVSLLPGISEVVVSLLNNSATVIVARKDLVGSVTETIDACGFEVDVIKIEPLIPLTPASDAITTGPRKLSLRVDGMYCQHCPAKIMTALKKLQPNVTIIKPLSNILDPVIEVSYIPSPPDFTIRSIISAIVSVESTSYSVLINRPPTLEERTHRMQQREKRTLLLHLIFTFIITIPTFIIGVVYMSLLPAGDRTRLYLMEPMWNGNASRIEWALFFLATPVYFYGAGLFHRRSIKEIKSLWRKGSPTPVIKRFTRFGSMNLLVSSGVTVAYFSSIVVLALAATQPPSSDGAAQETTYFDYVVFLTMFLLAGRYLEAYSKARTADAITALGSLRPAEALILAPRSASDFTAPAIVSREDPEKCDMSCDNGSLVASPGFKFEKVPVDLLEVGDVVRVQNGATPPSDGTIVSGAETSFDESSLTGEARLIKKNVGDKVLLGTINKSRAVDVRVDAVGGVSLLDQIVQIVREGQTRRAPIERVADHITGVFVPIITLLAIVTWLIWLALGVSGAIPSSYLDISVGGWVVWSLEFAIAVFVVACPCGIGLAAPTALLVGSGLAAKHGILARGGGEAFQEMAQLDIVVFDKTGTLTEGGEPRVSDAEILLSSVPEEMLLGIAAELESASSHPLANAIRQYAGKHGAASVTGSAFDEIAGKGVKADFDDMRRKAIIGNEALMRDHEVLLSPDVLQMLERWKSEAKSIVLLAVTDADLDSRFVIAAIFAVSDPIRQEAAGVVRHLKEQGIGTWMISGDNETTAKAVAKSVGIPEMNVIAGVLPQQKAEKIEWLQHNGAKRPSSRWQRMLGRSTSNQRCVVAMVGDGINDAPALAVSDIGIAIGCGSDIALSSASFILLSSNLKTLLTLSDLSRKVFNRVKINFMWAFMYNLIAVPIAAGVVYPAGHARLAPVWASLAMALSSVSVICSSLALKLYREPKIKL
ncbi:heavy metal translocatin [Suillus clintonianus]|uniref:heavy metal translocatin n=1 Tax=Suillus clintonianus TaxID=1904413 RepID=UPI001B875E31|nr:heavy metal translocatin [Suillus clintonianus]KAG2156041.1 heavy metal translocatin [Suillus clintonianus]